MRNCERIRGGACNTGLGGQRTSLKLDLAISCRGEYQTGEGDNTLVSTELTRQRNKVAGRCVLQPRYNCRGLCQSDNSVVIGVQELNCDVIGESLAGNNVLRQLNDRELLRRTGYNAYQLADRDGT